MILLVAADQKRAAKVLAQGIRRLAETGTWKQWQWDASSKPHTTAASFRQAATQTIIFQASPYATFDLDPLCQAEFLSVQLIYWKACGCLSNAKTATSP